jgi:hypothetical protein
LQDYFIQKGEADFAGINKIIVRAYLKGTSIHGTPYASLNLVAGKKDIMINEGAEKIEELIEKPSKEAVQEPHIIIGIAVAQLFCICFRDC